MTKKEMTPLMGFIKKLRSYAEEMQGACSQCNCTCNSDSALASEGDELMEHVDAIQTLLEENFKEM